jgi:hypothetical protein
MAVSDNRKKASPGRTKATSAGEWRKAASMLPLIETPTGKFIRMKKPGMTKFLEDGFLPDSLAGALRKEIASAKKKPGAKATTDAELMRSLTEGMDEAGLMDMMASMDRIVARVVVEPPIVWHRRPVREDPEDPTSAVMLDAKGREVTEEIPEDRRRADVVYTDEVDQADKNFIFQVAVGGSTNLDRFRKEQAAVMDTLSAGKNVEEAPERAPAPQS